MISHFPHPYPDELLYSVFARFSARVRYPSEQSVLKDLFGTIHTVASVNFPGHLNYLAAALPTPTGYTADYLISNHTCFPFFEPFLTKDRAKQVREHMYGTGNGIYALLGFLASHIPQPRWLRLCPQCITEDRDRYGECYWHRVHQVPGVEVCPIHQGRVYDSAVRAQNSLERQVFVPAEHAAQSLSSHPCEAVQTHRSSLLALAQDIQWLLSQHLLPVDFQTFHQLYLKQLVALGFASHHKKRVEMEKLTQAVKRFYPPELLQLLHCELDEVLKDNWVIRLLIQQRYVHHPLRHLLFMQFLGYTAEAFFALDLEEKPFGDGPWPCLNPASDHYQEKRILEYRLSCSKYVKRRPPVGTFSCSCGFTYARTGPDTSDNDLFRCDRILSFGWVWEAKLRRLWEDPTVSFKRLVAELQTTTFLVKRQVARLGLSTDEQTQRTIYLEPRHQPAQPIVWVVDPVTREEYREKWLRVMQEYPDAGRNTWLNEARKAYQWLRRNDSEWIAEKLATCQKRHKNYIRTADWEKRDGQLVEEVKNAIDQMRNAHPPKKITLTAVTKHIHGTHLSGNLHHYPRTATFLAEHLDTNESYALRRIEWVTELYCEEHICPRKWSFIQRAGLRNFVDAPKVKEALDLALMKLQPGDMENV